MRWFFFAYLSLDRGVLCVSVCPSGEDRAALGRGAHGYGYGTELRIAEMGKKDYFSYAGQE